MVKSKKKWITCLSTIVLGAVLMIPASASAAVYVNPFEPDSASNPHIFSVGDWSFPTLTPGDTDYFRFTNPYSYSRIYTLVVDSPDGYNYSPSMNGTGVTFVTPVVLEYGYYRFDITCNPGAVIDIAVAADSSGTSTGTYFITMQ